MHSQHGPQRCSRVTSTNSLSPNSRYRKSVAVTAELIGQSTWHADDWADISKLGLQVGQLRVQLGVVGPGVQECHLVALPHF